MAIQARYVATFRLTPTKHGKSAYHCPPEYQKRSPYPPATGKVPSSARIYQPVRVSIRAIPTLLWESRNSRPWQAMLRMTSAMKPFRRNRPVRAIPTSDWRLVRHGRAYQAVIQTGGCFIRVYYGCCETRNAESIMQYAYIKQDVRALIAGLLYAILY